LEIAPVQSFGPQLKRNPCIYLLHLSPGRLPMKIQEALLPITLTHRWSNPRFWFTIHKNRGSNRSEFYNL